MTNVLIAVDDSEDAPRVAKTAYRLFGETSDYTVINVAPGPEFPALPLSVPGVELAAGGPVLLMTPQETAAEEAIETYEAQRTAGDIAAAAGIKNAHRVGDVGDVVAAINAAASGCRADVIVVGVHDRSWFKRLIWPSVTQAVVNQAVVPVLVVR